MNTQTSTKENLNRIIDFRQGIYEAGFTKASDAQFELLDALLLTLAIRSFPELSLSPAFRRQWPSAYKAIEKGGQDTKWIEKRLHASVTQEGVKVYSLDTSDWPQPKSYVIDERQYVHRASSAVNGGDIVAGQSYSNLALVEKAHSSWALPMSIKRVRSDQTAVEVGVEQIRNLLASRKEMGDDRLNVITGDAAYGNHRFLGPLRDAENLAVVVKLRKDRVLYFPPESYLGQGRPAKHGKRFAFKEPHTWGDPDEEVTFEDTHWGQVRLRCWHDLHAKDDADTIFSVIRVETHLERDHPKPAIWLAYMGPKEICLRQRWQWYDWRWPIEPAFRFRKQWLYWTLPRFQSLEACDRWTMLVTLAQWQLYLARDLISDQPLPWQPPQDEQTPERVKQGLAGLFSRIGTPACAPRTRGKSPGWPAGRPRKRKKRRKPVKKTK